MKKSNTFSASQKPLKFRTYKLQTMLKTFMQKFFEYVKYFFRYDLRSMNVQKQSKHCIVCLKTGAVNTTKIIKS